MLVSLLDQYRTHLDLSSVQVEGLLIRYEVLAQNGFSMNILTCILWFILRIDKKVRLT